MPHSKNKQVFFNTHEQYGTMSCSCGKIMDYMNPKFKDLHGHRFACLPHKTDDFYAEIANDVEERFDTSGYIPDRPLPIEKNKKVIGLMKDELGGTIITEFVSLNQSSIPIKS